MNRLRLDGEVTVPWAAERKAELLAFLQPLLAEPGAEAVIELGGVTELDTAGLQLLLLARAEGARNGTGVRLVDPSEPVRAALRLARLEDLVEPIEDPAEDGEEGR